MKIAEREALESFTLALKNYKGRIEIFLPKNLASNSAGFLLAAEIFKIAKF